MTQGNSGASRTMNIFYLLASVLVMDLFIFATVNLGSNKNQCDDEPAHVRLEYCDVVLLVVIQNEYFPKRRDSRKQVGNME